MAKIAKSLTELIGNTPLVQLSNYSAKKGMWFLLDLKTVISM